MMINNTTNKKLIYLFVVSIAFFSSCGNKNSKNNDSIKPGNTVTVFAAASLTDVFAELVDSFQVTYQSKVIVNLASSGTLARQIEQGAAPDVYISASEKWANYMDSLGYILQGYKAQIAQNNLVLVAPLNSLYSNITIDSSIDFETLLEGSRLSIGDPAHVPAGKYAKQSLEYFGWYARLSNQLLPTKDVRSALMVVEMEEAPLGIVYNTDALKSKKVKILSSFPEKSHDPIVYIAGVCNGNSIAMELFTFINSSQTDVIWHKYGFKK